MYIEFDTNLEMQSSWSIVKGDVARKNIFNFRNCFICVFPIIHLKQQCCFGTSLFYTKSADFFRNSLSTWM